MLITTTAPKYEEVSELEFATYLHDIKQRLQKDAPEWHVNKHVVGHPPRTMYHLCRWDFSKGKHQIWPIHMGQHIFAYEEGDKYYLFNQHPIVEKEKK